MKKNFYFLTMLIICSLFPISASAELVISAPSHSGYGISGGGNTNFVQGGWLSNTYGVRVTLVDQKGDRLRLETTNGTYISDSVDFYGGASDVKSNLPGSNLKNAWHSQCTKSDGSKTLCMRKDINSKLTMVNGGYKYRDISEIGGWLSNFMKGGQTPDNWFKTLEYSWPKSITSLEQIFELLMGVSVESVTTKSGNACKENEELLENAYIIYEPLTAYGHTKIATGTEFAFSIGFNNHQNCTIRQLADAVTVPHSTGNLGLEYYDPVSLMKISGNCVNSDKYWSFLNTKNGYALGIVKLSAYFLNENKLACNATDYSVDAACVDCKEDDTDDNNRSTFVIQDTTSWEGILRSNEPDYMCETATHNQKANVADYYIAEGTTGCGNIYCREEVRVVFPNANDTPTIERGRYFTVHSPFWYEDNNTGEWKIKSYSPDYAEDAIILSEHRYDHNWGAIKIVKTKECRMKNNENDAACLNENSKNLEFKKVPEVTLTYKGIIKDNPSDTEMSEFKQYEEKLTNLALEVEPTGEFGSGTSVETKKVESSNLTFDNGQLNSYHVYKTTQTSTYKLPGTMFRYILKDGGQFVDDPEGKAHIDLGIATIPVSQNNKVLSEKDATLSLSFKLDNDMHLSESFIESNDFLPNCSSDSEEDPTNIYKYVNKKTHIKLNSKNVSGFMADESKKIQELASSACAKLHKCSTTKDGISCKKAGVNSCINDRTSNKIGKKGSNCYVNSIAGNDGNSNYICSVYVDPGIPDIPELPKEECPGCREEVDKDPNCIVSIGSNVCLPATGYNKLIYRPIDLTSPFPAQDGSGRKTGANWCGYDTQLKRYSCSNENPVVEEYILNNRGVKGEDVYKLNPMYEVKLTPEKIKEIQAYNRGKSYDNFTLTCETDGTRCEMTIQGTLGVETNCDIDRSDPKCEKQYNSGGGS